MTVSRAHAVSPLRGATTIRDGRPISGSGTPGSPELSLWTDGSGKLETPNALLGPSEARCWPKVGAGALSPETDPSQVKTCSSSSSSGSSEASTPALGTWGARLDASEHSTAAASGGSAVSCTATRSVSSIERAMASRSAPSGGNHCGRIAITWPPASMPDASACTSRSASSAAGTSMKVSIRPSLPTKRSGFRPKARITGTWRWDERSDACPAGLSGTT